MNIIEKITELSVNTPEKIAIQTEQSIITYLEFEQLINKTANALINLGVKKGDRVLIQISNRIEFMYTYFGTIKAGALIVPINPLYTPSEISYIVSNSEPSVYICESVAKNNVKTVKELSTNLLGVYVLDEDDSSTNFNSFIENQPKDFFNYSYDKDEVCEILYTSGTTGTPKGAMLTHDGLYTNAVAYSTILQCNSNDVSLIVAPLYHAAAQTNCMNTMIVSGASNYLLPRFEPAKVLQTLQDKGITYFFGPPTMYTILLNQPNINEYNFVLRIAFTGSAAMPVEVHNRWKEVFGFDVLEGYGLSECSPIVSNHRPDGVKKIGSVGPALPDITVKVFNENDEELPIGDVGEIVVKGPNVMKGYWRKPEETNAVIKNDWFYTGDYGYMDDDGYIYIIDRKKDMVIRGGLKIYPREVEEVLYKHPKILEVSVIGVPDEVMGEEAAAFYTLKNPADKIDDNELKLFCKEQLAPYKVPKYFKEIDEFPKTLSGKIQKVKLKETQSTSH